MNRSHTKIRHIQEANRMLEKRVIEEEVNATCAVGTQGTLKYQNGKYGIMTSDGGFCIVPANAQTSSGGNNVVKQAVSSMVPSAMNQMGKH